MAHNYILNGHEPVPEPDIRAWAKWFEEPANRVVKQDHIGETFVSTVFLGIDHNWLGGTPILFETMIFDSPLEIESQWRYHTWDEAEAGHQKVTELVRQMYNDPQALVDEL